MAPVATGTGTGGQMPQKEGWGTASSPRFGNVDLGVPSWYQMMDEWHSIRLTIH